MLITSSLKSLVLSVSIATLITFTTAAPAPPVPPAPAVSHLDPCGLLGAKEGKNISYHDVANCYHAIPFNNDHAATTLSTIHTLFDQFYIFKDAAMDPNLRAPFSSPPTDIIKRLETIGRTKYSSDYLFHDDIRRAINSLYDAHSAYSVECYSSHYFLNNIFLYAPVIDNVQTVRVYRDLAKSPQRQYENCLVRTIDGVDALTYLRNWVDEKGSNSHDAGVRLNAALSFQYFDIETKTFQNADSPFSVRSSLPPTESIKYEIQCDQAETFTLTEDWRVISLAKAKFHNVNTFVENVCMPHGAPEPAANSLHDEIKGLRLNMREEPAHYKRYLEYKGRVAAEAAAAAEAVKDAAPTPPPAPAPDQPEQQFAGADLIGAGEGTAFYHLKNQPDVGVLVYHTFNATPETEVEIISRGLKAFHDLGVTKLVIDFQGNGGGYVQLAANTVQTFFPSDNLLDTNLASDLRSTPAIQLLAAASFNKTLDIFDAAGYIDFNNQNQAYTDDSLFTQPVTYTRGGRTSEYSQTTTATTAIAPTDPALATFAWTNNAANIRILTDGRCGSSCAIVAHFLTYVYKVQAYAIGGNNGKALSMYSFAGGTVSNNQNIDKYYTELGLTSPIQPLPYTAKVSLPILEIYAHGSVVPLEYDAEIYPASYRMPYTTENSQDRHVMWGEVASHAWPTN
ncbi:hypothetical protein BGZ96_002876 [Linnemannia gamsii]|uniref:Tail specific protease domain-containing protein n=1 Tax=Linnemannia gamsii TaxID=64522 RepID=A0ABQ7JK48_9FUNG|nr:hypothetical protein BGZ96_002876 [Linnemannia gamsii]